MQFAVGVVPDLAFGADDRAGRRSLEPPARSDILAGLDVMAGAAVGHRHNPHHVAQITVDRREPAGAHFGVVRMRDENEQAQGIVSGHECSGAGRSSGDLRFKVARRACC